VGDNLESAGASAGVPDNDAPWEFMLNNVMPYMEYLRLTVPAGEVLEYQPVSYIVGTTLPDTGADGVAQDGTIVWGNNPSGVNTTVASLQASAVTTEGEVMLPPDALQPLNPDPLTGGESGMQGENIFLYPVIRDVMNQTNTPIIFAWMFLAIIFILCAGASVHKYTQNLAMTGLVMVLAFAMVAGMSLMPKWVVLIALLIVIPLLATERSPNL
jgi:hypothetical protein